MGTRRISDNEILEQVLAGKTSAEAAQVLGCSAGTVRLRCTKPAFKKRLNQARAEILEGTVERLRRGASEAVEVLTAVMTDENVSAQTRCYAAERVLSNFYRATEILDFERRLSALEDRQDETSA